MSELVHEIGVESAAEAVPQYVPSVYLEVSKEQLEILEVGANVQITLLGKVKGLSADEKDKGNDRYNIDLELKSVKINSEDTEIGKLLDEDE